MSVLGRSLERPSLSSSCKAQASTRASFAFECLSTVEFKLPSRRPSLFHAASERALGGCEGRRITAAGSDDVGEAEEPTQGRQERGRTGFTLGI